MKGFKNIGYACAILCTCAFCYEIGQGLLFVFDEVTRQVKPVATLTPPSATPEFDDFVPAIEPVNH